MNCPHPIDRAVLADYWAAALDRLDEDAVEEHLLGCDECGSRLLEFIAIADAVRDIAREGTLRMVVSDAVLQRAEVEGLRVRRYALAPGGAVQCTVGADDDILVARLTSDLSGAGRVDLCICDADGVEQIRMTDVPVRPGADSVIYQESISFIKAAPSLTMIARLVSIDDAGGERVLGEYTFNHRRSLPAPGAQ